MADIEKRMMEIVKDNCKPDNVPGESAADRPLTPMERRIEAGIKNLKPMTERTEEEQKKIAMAGGKASVEARRKKKAIREVCETILSMKANSGLKAKINPDIELPEGATVYDVLVASMTQEAIDGNVKAAEFIRDSAGDKPTDKTEVTAAVMTDKDLEVMAMIKQRMMGEESTGGGQNVGK